MTETAAIVLATRNPDKAVELQALLAESGISVRLSAESDLLPPVVEDAPDLEGNASKKALALARATGLVAVADDTGIEVDALGGAPGVRSARYSGDGASYAENVEKLLGALRSVRVPGRGATFRTVIAIATPDEIVELAEGRIRGTVTTTPRGGYGFGYDPVFEPEGLGRTFAEMAPQEKNAISHRARALAVALPVIRRLITSSVPTRDRLARPLPAGARVDAAE